MDQQMKQKVEKLAQEIRAIAAQEATICNQTVEVFLKDRFRKLQEYPNALERELENKKRLVTHFRRFVLALSSVSFAAPARS